MSQSAPYYPQPGYVPAAAPGKTLGIVGFILALLGPLTFVGLILSIIAFVQSRKANVPNGLALAGIIIGAVGTLIGVALIAAGIVGAGALLQQCAELGPGVHQVNGITITCG